MRQQDIEHGSKLSTVCSRSGSGEAHFMVNGESRFLFRVGVRYAYSKENAMVIARACFVRYADGANKAEITAFRNDLYAKIAAVLGSRPAPHSTFAILLDKQVQAAARASTHSEIVAPSSRSSKVVRENDVASTVETPSVEPPNAEDGSNKDEALALREAYGKLASQRLAVTTMRVPSTKELSTSKTNVPSIPAQQADGKQAGQKQAGRVRMGLRPKHLAVRTMRSKQGALIDASSVAVGLSDEVSGAPEREGVMKYDDEDVLPPDAPPGHPAWNCVRYYHRRVTPTDSRNSPMARFFHKTTGYTYVGGAKARSKANAMRICRACYVKVHSGASKRDVIAFRNDALEKLAEKYALQESLNDILAGRS